MKFYIILIGLFIISFAQAQTSPLYSHDSVRISDHSKKPTGFWLFEPADPVPDTARVIVFLHGYGGYNPMIYGAWIKHLVRQGNTIIFPIYQRNMVFPRPPRFVKNTVKGIQSAMDLLKTVNHVSPLNTDGPVHYIGHSYGGVITANISANFQEWSLPQPKGILLLAPGSGPFKGAVLDQYEGLNDSIKMLVITHQNDRVVGNHLGLKIFNESSPMMEKYLFDHQPFSSGGNTIRAHHNEAYAVDFEFDSGIRNYTSKRALQLGKTDRFDQYFLWPLLDQLIIAIDEERVVFPDLINNENRYYQPFVLTNGMAPQLIEVKTSPIK